jgi:hypothetical protein
MAEAIYEIDSERFVPTELARGPWTPEAQHGGPPAALLARALERYQDGEGMFVARLTVELLRPVPLTLLTVVARMTRPGRKVQLIEASMNAGETEVARAVALRIRRADVELPSGLVASPPPAGPEQGKSIESPFAGYAGFHNYGVEHRFVAGGFDRAGPATDWIRLRVPLIAGEPTSPLCRVVVAADFGNGVSWVLPRTEGYQFINPDLTIYLYRLPQTEWVCLEAATSAAGHGVGLAESRLWDETGPIGRSLQSLLIDRGM